MLLYKQKMLLLSREVLVGMERMGKAECRLRDWMARFGANVV